MAADHDSNARAQRLTFLHIMRREHNRGLLPLCADFGYDVPAHGKHK